MKISNKTTWWHIIAAALICLLIGIVAHTAKAQNYAQADSIGVIFQDSTVRLYFEWNQDDGSIIAEYTKRYDTITAVNFVFNTTVQANNQTFDALKILGRTRNINRFTSNASSVLSQITGRTYRQTSEMRFANKLALTCDSTGQQCQSFYTFRQEGQPNKILRIRKAANGNLTCREVNNQGNNVAGGLQANIIFKAGTNLFELAFTAGPLNGTTITLYNFGLTENNRPIWMSLNTSFLRVFSLIQRASINDVEARVVEK